MIGRVMSSRTLRQDPGGPHVGPTNFAIWDVLAVTHEPGCVMMNWDGPSHRLIYLLHTISSGPRELGYPVIWKQQWLWLDVEIMSLLTFDKCSSTLTSNVTRVFCEIAFDIFRNRFVYMNITNNTMLIRWRKCRSRKCMKYCHASTQLIRKKPSRPCYMKIWNILYKRKSNLYLIDLLFNWKTCNSSICINLSTEPVPPC